MLVEIFRSKKKEGMYLYVKKGTPLDRLPEALLNQFGRAESAMMLMLTPDKKLARAKAEKVIESIESQGFYLQLPPVLPAEPSMPNDKLTYNPI